MLLIRSSGRGFFEERRAKGEQRNKGERESTKRAEV